MPAKNHNISLIRSVSERGLNDHTSLYTRKSPIHGLGLFSHVHLPKGTPIAPFDGAFFCAKTDNDLPTDQRGFPIQIRDNLVQSCSGFAGMSNHSCNPNAGLSKIGSFYWIVARRAIEKNEEICWDYSMSQWLSDFIFYPHTDCNCCFSHCRKKQLGSEFLKKDIVKTYLKEGWGTDFIREQFWEKRGLR